MNKSFVLTGLAFVIAVFCNCKGSRYISQPGEVVESVSEFWRIKNNVNVPYIFLSEKAWYQDNIGIAEICRIMIEETDTSRHTNVITIGYRFVDLKKKWAYEYESFSDTSAVIRKYQYTDTTVFPGGWNFANRKPHTLESSQFLADTTINQTFYKRSKITFVFNQTRFEGIGMFRCDIKNTIFQIDTAMSNTAGCPLVSLRTYSVTNPNSGIDRQIKFVSNQFPDSVRKVFAAWKKNESLYPVH